ncbi:PREDICTED: uncharacterized protein LOC105450213 [Wasmannia auropunctata]|uniref:uncharacterized protein LOC105450213 n=1 Tax=Wasmannia auropunctata TaxID=64793 RepID=UPI0005F0064B|nr:PREDICTED: uncharacterized protein LOC105450213 [Wasmannia auropunctata]
MTGKRGKRSGPLDKNCKEKLNMEGQNMDNSPSGLRNPEERREGDSCPCPPASTTSKGSGAGGTTTPSPMAAIVKMERVNLKVIKKPEGKIVLSNTDVSMDETEDEVFEKPKKIDKAKKKKTEAPSRPKSPELEYVSTYEAGPSSRPTTPRNPDIELVSYTPGTRSRRNSDSSASKKRKRKSSPEDTDEDERTTLNRFTDAQRQDVEDLLDQIEELSSADMAARVTDWLGEVEEYRRKSRNIKGSFTRQMKVKVAASAEATKVLAMRASMEGDIGFMRAKILELQNEMKTVKEENQRLKLQLEDLRNGAPLFGNAKEDGAQGEMRSPGPSAEFFSPVAEMSHLMEVGPLEDARRTPARLRGSPPRPSTVGPPIGEEFFARLTTAISQAVAGAIREHLPGADRRGPQAEPGPRRTQGTRFPERLPSSSTVAEPMTDEDGKGRQKSVSKRQQKRKSRAPRDEVPNALGKSFKERMEECNATATDEDPLPVAPAQERPRPVVAKRENVGTARRRVPRSSAVTLSFPGSMRFADVVKKARDSVKLEDIGIQHTRLRTTMSGAVLVEIPGKDMSPKADALAAKLRETFGDSEVRVARPSLRGEIRLSGLDASLTPEEVKTAMADKGGCAVEDIRLGQYRITRNGFRTVWAQCPLGAAMDLAQEGGLRVGWSTSRVDLLKKRPVQCFKCFATGHVREKCPSTIDRSTCCFNCGAEGHRARECGKPPDCPICREQGRRHDHRAGSDACPPCPPKTNQNQSPLSRRKSAESPLPQRKPADRRTEAGSSQQ